MRIYFCDDCVHEILADLEYSNRTRITNSTCTIVTKFHKSSAYGWTVTGRLAGSEWLISNASRKSLIDMIDIFNAYK